MMTVALREQLYKQIETLPDDVVEQIADFTMFIMARRKIAPEYVDWSDEEWQTFTLQQFFRDDDDDVTYTLEDAVEVYIYEHIE